MRILLLISSCLFIMTTWSCSPKYAISFERTGKVNCTAYEDKVIHLSSESTASNVDQGIRFAERNAFENILFKGVPASNQEQPMIENELNALRKHPSYFEELLKQERYQRFILKSELVENHKSSGAYFITQLISIDLQALRKDLENQKVVRNFGI